MRSISGMAKVKTSVTVDPAKVAEVRRLTGAPTTSAAVDIALAELIAAARVRRDIEAYTRVPPTIVEAAGSPVEPDWSDLVDDTDWEAEYLDEHR